MTKKISYKVTLRVRDDIGVIARITTRLRKFQVSIRSIDVEPLDKAERFFDIHLVIKTDKKNVAIIMKKVECLIPVLEARFEEI